MSNTEDFDTETTELDAELDTAAEAPAKPAKAAAKKSGGGGFGKFLVLLLLLGGGGAAGAEHFGIIKLPFNIPGVSPSALASLGGSSAMPAAPAHAPVKLAQISPATGTDAMPPDAGLDPLGSTAKKPEKTEKNEEAGMPMPPALGAAPIAATGNGKPGIQAPSNPGAGTDDPLAELNAPPAANTAAPAGIPAPAAIPSPLGAPPADADADALAAPGGPAMTAAPPAGIETPTAMPAMPSTPMATAPAMPAPSAPPVAAGPDPESAAKIKELEDKVAGLQKDLSDEQQKAADAEKKAAAASAKHAVKQAASEDSDAAPVAAKPKHTSKPRHTAATGAKSVGAKPASTHWVLKSAKPGVAWVAIPGSSELKTVSVGDSLPGIGKVTAVAKDSSGRWSVSGSRGRIDQ